MDSPPLEIHKHKDRRPSAHFISGSAVFLTEVTRALLTYGSYDRYCFRRGQMSQQIDPSGGWASVSDRVEYLDSHNIDELSRFDQPILASGLFSDLVDHQALRQLFSSTCDWPITGMVFAVESKFPPPWMLWLASRDVRPWDALICCSNAQRKAIDHHLDALPEFYPHLTRLQSVPRMQLPVIPLGTESIPDDTERRASVRRRLAMAEDEVMILYVGRFSPTTKADLIPLVVAFAASFAAGHRNARLVLAGDDTRYRMADALTAVAERLGCGDRVIVDGDPTSTEKLDLYYAADVFVSPADHTQEAFGITLIEAFAAGLPVIASNWDGYRDVVIDGETGFLVPTYWTDLGPWFDLLHLCGRPAADGILPGATVVNIERLTESLTLLTQDAERRKRMGRNARRAFFERFHWRVVVAQYESLWDELKARARREASSSPPARRSLGGTVKQTFEHYPTRTLGDDCLVSLGPMAARLDPLLRSLKSIPAKAIPSFDEIARELVNQLSMDGSLPIGELVSRASGLEVGSALSTRLTAARLLKYGVFRPMSAS